MSLRLPKTRLNLSDVGSDDDSETASSVDDAGETWSDWVSDSMSKQPCRSLFEEKTLPSVSEALEYDKTVHGFDLNALCDKLGALNPAIKFRAKMLTLNP